MSITPADLTRLSHAVNHLGGFYGRRMIQLSLDTEDQPLTQFPTVVEGSKARQLFETLGVKYTVVCSAIESLGKVIVREEWLAAFDLVTDYGVSEHMGTLTELWHVRANCHRWCRTGGLLVYVNPRTGTGNWPWHGKYYFTLAHYKQLAKANGYQVFYLSEDSTEGGPSSSLQITAVLVKSGYGTFMPEDQFKRLCEGTVLAA